MCRLSGHTRLLVSLLCHRHRPLLFSGSDDFTVRVWSLETRSLLLTLEGHEHNVWGLAHDRAGDRLASCGRDQTVRLWDIGSGECLHTLRHPNWVFTVTWSPSGSRVASGSADNSVRVWNSASGVLEHTLSGHSGDVNAVLSHPTEDLLASGSTDRSVRIWRWSSGSFIRALLGHAGAVNSLACSSRFLVSGSADASVRVWSWDSDAPVRTLGGFALPLGGLNSLDWRNGTLVSIESERWDKPGTVRVWDTSPADPRAWKCVGSLGAKSRCGWGVTLLHDGSIACGGTKDLTTIFVWGF